jgi:hypothetical protein
LKKIITLFLALSLIIPSTVAVVVATQDENPDYVIKQMEDVLYLELREAVGKNFISQSLASRILWIWN